MFWSLLVVVTCAFPDDKFLMSLLNCSRKINENRSDVVRFEFEQSESLRTLQTRFRHLFVIKKKSMHACTAQQVLTTQAF